MKGIWPVKIKIASILSLVVGSISFVSGMSVLTGLREVEYSALPLLIFYNTVFGVLAVIAGIGLWKRNGWAGKLTAVIAGSHFVVLTLVSYAYLMGGPVASESLNAMVFRVLVWVCIVLLIPRRNRI
jgi:uncharacterized membrane protein (DUF2068 family)